MSGPDLGRRRIMAGLVALAGRARAALPAPVGAALPPGWRLDAALSDEFEGERLDAERWLDHDPIWAGRPPSRFEPRHVGQAGGQLRLLSTGEPPQAPTTYRTAAVKTRRPLRYGYLEARARAGASAISSAFWLYAKDEQRWTEIDVFELSAAPGRRNTLYTAVHVFYDHTGPRRPELHATEPTALDFAVHEDFHVYGLAWTAERIEWRVDGRLVRSLPNTRWHQALHVMFDSEVSLDWFGRPDASTLPARFDVEYLRVWRAGTGDA